jgi:hypothetical protein
MLDVWMNPGRASVTGAQCVPATNAACAFRERPARRTADCPTSSALTLIYAKHWHGGGVPSSPMPAVGTRKVAYSGQRGVRQAYESD